VGTARCGNTADPAENRPDGTRQPLLDIGEEPMGNDQEIQGNWDQAKGKVKEEVGDLTDNEKMEYEGKLDQTKGKVEEGVGNVRDDLDHATDPNRP